MSAFQNIGAGFEPELKPVPIIAVVYAEVLQAGSIRRVAVVQFDEAGRITFEGDAPKAFEFLLHATRKCTAKLILQDLDTALSDALTATDPPPPQQPPAGEVF